MSKRLQKGFTLVEVLVILAILAILAGVLLPAVFNQVTKADAGRAAEDLENFRTAIETFTVDVKRYPGDIEDLIAAITTGDDDALGTAFPAGLIGKWSGPYVDAADAATTDSFPSGFGGAIVNDLDTAMVGSQGYVSLILRNVTQSDFYKIDARVDGDTGTAKGRLRFRAGTTPGTSDSTVFLALPITN